MSRRDSGVADRFIADSLGFYCRAWRKLICIRSPSDIAGFKPKSKHAYVSDPLRSDAMIGVTGQNGDGTIELFGNQDADQLVRPGHLAEADGSIGTAVE